MGNALTLLERHGSDAKLLAGGQSLVPMMKLRLVSPKHIVDLGKVGDLRYIREEKGRIKLGSMATHYMVESSSLIRDKCPILSEAASQVADRLVRNRGTVGGSISHADPAGDYAPIMLALGAEFQVASSTGGRTINAREFFMDMFTTALRPSEILTEVSVPIASGKSGGAYLKFERVAGDFAIVGVAAQVTIGAGGKLEYVGIGVSGAGPVALRASAAEEILRGRVPDDSLYRRAAEKVVEASRPSSDLSGSSEYKREMIKVYVEDALRLAVRRATGRA